jgi:K+-transporting ATPase KdpF subunit
LRRRRDLQVLHPQESPMTFLYALAAVVALALTVYLTVALLKPEWFE